MNYIEVSTLVIPSHSDSDAIKSSFESMAVCSALSLYKDPFTPEPEAPLLSLGQRVVWMGRSTPGTVKWIGRIPQMNQGWTVGVAFDTQVLNGGDGSFNGRKYFSSSVGSALFLPADELSVLNSTLQQPSIVNSSCHCLEYDNDCHHRCGVVPHRESTYGNCRHNCHYVPYSKYEYVCNYRCCNKSPIYGRISSREPLKHVEDNYESYSPPPPQQPHIHRYSGRKHSPNGFRTESNHEIEEICDARHYKDEKQGTLDRIAYQDNHLSPVDVRYKDPFLNSRSTLKLIAGLKDWVSCLVLGMSRRRKKRSIVLNSKKTVASVMFTQTSQSLMKTGERLSAFGEYTTKAECTLPRNTEPKSINPRDNMKQNDKNISEKRYSNSHNMRHRKGPAPLPPLNRNQGNIPIKKQNVQHKEYDNQNSDIRTSSLARKNPKKRQAPLPPIVSGTQGKSSKTNTRLITSHLAEVECHLVPDDKLNDFRRKSSRNGNHSLRKETLNATHYIDDTSESESENGYANHPSYTFYADDSDADLRNDITLYSGQKDKEQTNKEHILAGNDMKLKISIAKTEMNVVTFEQYPEGSDAEDSGKDSVSSLSEMSEHEQDINERVYENRVPEVLKSSSSDDSPQPETKPIFEELKLKTQGKASVKEIVQAFNMLADRERHGKGNHAKQEHFKGHDLTNSGHADAGKNGLIVAEEQNIESFPTKWQFQKPTTFGSQTLSNFATTSSFLLPIEEESHNELSDRELKRQDNNKLLQYKGTSSKENGTSPEPATKHEYGLSNRKLDNSKKHELRKLLPSVLKKTAPYVYLRPQDRHKSENNKPFDVADVTVSLLMNQNPSKDPSFLKEFHGTKSKNSASSKFASKAEESIVVSLYIEDKASHKGPIPFVVSPSMTLRKLKKKVEKEYNFDKDLQCWILGETFAIHDEATLSSYGVKESGCPILLYVMSVESQNSSLPSKLLLKSRRARIYDDVARSSSESEDVENLLDREIGRRHKRSKPAAASTGKSDVAQKYLLKPPMSPSSKSKLKRAHHAAKDKEAPKKKDYHALVEMDDLDLVSSVDAFECPVCFLDILPGEGVILQECLHCFCKECLAGAVEFSDTALIKCPFRNDEYSCESHLQEREIKSLVSHDVFERHLQRSMALAESQAQNSFHCKTPDCMGWCLFEDNVNTFFCPVCKHTNCLTCAAVHEGKNCRQYQDEVAILCDSSEEAKKTKEYLENMVKDGDAMKCPQCAVILMKKWGCDWLKCSMCHTEVCWVTKGPRWGPGGRGDTSGGCKCMLTGVRCHPKCNYCH